MSPRHRYAILSILGLVIPSSAFLSWLLMHGVNPGLFVRDLFANGVSSFFALDVILSAVTLIVFVRIEGARIHLPQRWIPIAATLLLGVSVGLPLFLYQRQVHLDRAAG